MDKFSQNQDRNRQTDRDNLTQKPGQSDKSNPTQNRPGQGSQSGSRENQGSRSTTDQQRQDRDQGGRQR